MKRKTILKLNKINKEFYKKQANSFSETRSFYWQGWARLMSFLRKDSRSAVPTLDLGCGNARFAEFLFQNFNKKVEYFGIDSSKELLEKADRKLKKLNINYKLQNLDIIKLLLENKFRHKVKNKFNLITLFGLWHHVPSFKLRKRLMQDLESLLAKNGVLIFTLWQFKKERYEKRLKKLKTKNDYLLDWKNNRHCRRYCHFIDDQELKELLKNTKLKIKQEFFSDGRTGNMNKYITLV